MNANELADRLDKISYDCTIEEWRASPVGEAAAKLRQQQESIEGLTRDYDLLFAEHQLLRKKEWVGLTEEEVDEIYTSVQEEVSKHWDKGGTTMFFPFTLYKALEQALKDKNTRGQE
jgi:hypothetical protein